MSILNRKLNWLFDDNTQFRKRLSEAEAEMDIRNREQRNVDVDFYETNRELESELYQAYQWADQIQREKIYSFGELEMRNTFFQRSRVRNLKEIEELPSFLAECPFLVRGTNN